MAALDQPTRPLVHLSVRRVPARALEPPYDDELDGVSSPPSTDGTLALAFPLPSGVPAVPDPPARLRLVPPTEEDAERRGTAMPPPRPWAGRLVQAVVEVLAGDRPLAQLARWTVAGVYFDLQRMAIRASRERAAAVPRRPTADVVRSLHVSEPVAGVAEVCALIERGARVRALALRMEDLDGRWQCTALLFG